MTIDLSTARVMVVGVGGLGCPATWGLAAAGVGSLTLLDPDRVERSNLPRQPLYGESDLGALKVEVASRRLAAEFPRTRIDGRAVAVDPGNAGSLFASHHLIIDGTDGIETKLLLSDTSVATGVPLIYGAALRLEGQTMLIAPGGPCLRCLFETPPEADAAPTCAQAGVLGGLVGWVGASQACMALEALGGRAVPGVLTRFDARGPRQRVLRVRRASDCVAHGITRGAA